MGKCKYCQGEFDYIPGIGVCIGCKNAMSSSSSNSYDSRKEVEAERAKDRAMDWQQYTDQFGNKVRVSRTTGRFEVKRPFWGWMESFQGNIERRYPNGDLYVGGVHGSCYHGKGKKFWKETGNSYEGDWVYDNRTGKGRFTWANGNYYEGDFVEGKRTGKGKFVWSSGGYYEGDFVEGKFNGNGVRVYQAGGRYEGQFKDDMCHGKGKMTWPNGDIYEGDWFEDFRAGKGKTVWANGVYYEGEYLKGKCHGNGFRTYTDNYTYKGQFKDGVRHGKGVLTAPDGTAVEYYYENDKRVCKVAEATDEIVNRIYGTTPKTSTNQTSAQFTGRKEQEFSDGSKYIGDFVNGKMSGKGKYIWKDGSYYEGDFVDGNFQGYGVRVYPSGSRYEGYWVNDLPSGKGKYTWVDGDYYEGDFLNDKFHGHGKYVYPSGAYYEGTYVNDKRTGKGKYTWDDGTYYEGDFLDGKYHGYGKKTSINGYIYEGEFQNNKRHGKGRRTSPTGKVREYYYENDKRVCEVSEATDEIIARIYGSTPPKVPTNSKVMAKTTVEPEVEEVSVSPAATETSTVTSDNLQAEPAKRTRKVATPEEIWDRLLKMTTSEKQEYFKKHHKLTVPAGTEVIPANCFKLCFELHNVVFNEELREIGEYAFSSTRIRGKLVIPKSVEKIGNHAFDMSRTIETVVLPNNITVDDYAFAVINDLAKVEFESDPPEGVIIGKGAFSRCHKHAMKSKEMVEKIKALNKKAFK